MSARTTEVKSRLLRCWGLLFVKDSAGALRKSLKQQNGNGKAATRQKGLKLGRQHRGKAWVVKLWWWNAPGAVFTEPKPSRKPPFLGEWLRGLEVEARVVFNLQLVSCGLG